MDTEDCEIFKSQANSSCERPFCLRNSESLFNFGTADLEPWGIPREMQTSFQLPVSKKNYFREKTDEESCQILYCPTAYTIHNADRIVVSISEQCKNITLTIVSDTHSVLDSSLPPNAKIVSRKAAIPVLKKAHVVLASGWDAIQAMANGIPCIIVGAIIDGKMEKICELPEVVVKAYGP